MVDLIMKVLALKIQKKTNAQDYIASNTSFEPLTFKDDLQIDQEIKTDSVVTNKNLQNTFNQVKYNDETSLETIIEDKLAFGFREEAKIILKKNYLSLLKDWKELSKEQKEIYPQKTCKYF